MKILSIETSCDETAIALVEATGEFSKPSFKILKNLVASQIKIHRPFGGVVPNLAKREHNKNLPELFRKISENQKTQILKSIDLIAVTVGPGLEPCLWTGINFAEGLTQKWNKPLIGVNHLKGHLYSFLLSQKRVNSKSQIPNSKNLFPAVALIVSGGHTILLLMHDLIHFQKLGETRDDAAGEAFDKAARLLGLSYPGGPEIEKLAIYGGSTSINFPRPMLGQKNYDFSFSGLKTALFYYLKNSCLNTKKTKNEKEKNSLHNFANKSDIAASFQQAIIDVLIGKTLRAAREFQAKTVLLSGGVAANECLCQTFIKKSKENNFNFLAPSLKFTTDNAAMTAVAAYFQILQKKSRKLRKLQANGNLSL